ncbi:MAG TPA: hypothetical protein V6D08_02405, partial [Candidatus Obscuribacterales bacterium]
MANVLAFLSQPIALAIAGALLLILAVAFGIGRYRYIKYHRPKSFFVRWLTTEQKNALTHAAVPFTVKSLGPGEEGVLFAWRDFKRARKVLRARVIESFELDDNRTHEVVLTFALPKDRALRAFRVTDAGYGTRWYERRWYRWFYARKLVPVVRDVLLPSVKTNVVVHSMGEPHEPIVDESFHVFLYSTSRGSSGQYLPDRLLGVPLRYRRHEAFVPGGLGVPIIDNATNIAVAELVDNCLYVHLDVIGNVWQDDPDLGLLVRVLQRVDEELVADKFLADIVRQANSQCPLPAGTTEGAASNVACEGFGGRRQTVVTSLVKEVLGPAVGTDVIVKNCAGSNQPPIEDGKFHILFHASPMGSASMDTPERIWGYRLLKRGPAFVPSASGVPIIDDGGFIVGELVGNNLYLHQEYIYYGARVEAALLARLLLEVRKQLSEARTATPETLSRRLAEHFEQECRRQVESCTARGLKATAQDMAKAQSNLRDLLKGTRLAEINLLRLEAAPQEELGREYDELLKLANVVDVRVSNDTLVVATKTLYCVNPKTKRKHEIGAFEIHISMRNQTIKWFNQTRKVTGGRRGMNAPHVDENGNACFGNTKELFPMLIARREFASVVQL